MVADTAEVARAGVGAEGFVARMGGIAFCQERDHHRTEGAAGRDGRGGETEIDELPLAVEADAAARNQRAGGSRRAVRREGSGGRDSGRKGRATGASRGGS